MSESQGLSPGSGLDEVQPAQYYFFGSMPRSKILHTYLLKNLSNRERFVELYWDTRFCLILKSE